MADGSIEHLAPGLARRFQLRRVAGRQVVDRLNRSVAAQQERKGMLAGRGVVDMQHSVGAHRSDEARVQLHNRRPGHTVVVAGKHRKVGKLGVDAPGVGVERQRIHRRQIERHRRVAENSPANHRHLAPADEIQISRCRIETTALTEYRRGVPCRTLIGRLQNPISRGTAHIATGVSEDISLPRMHGVGQYAGRGRK